MQTSLQIAPASLSVVDVDPWTVQVHQINHTVHRASTTSHSGSDSRNPAPNALDGV